jgi:leucine dehydrogenase
MTLFDSPAFEGHEEVLSFYDAPTGLKVIIAIHSTARGPSAGGCRMWNYASAEAALEDALKLSRAMSYKNAMADLELGGGKAVIIGDARTAKTPALFAALGRAIEATGGRYWAAEDVGVTPDDLAHSRKETTYVAGLEGHPAASGDPSPVTAEGVFRCLRLSVQRALGKDLDGVTVAVQGVGAVGGVLAHKLAAAGARLIVSDIDQAKASDLARALGGRAVRSEAIFDADAEVFAPCALGGALNEETAPRLKARVIVGGANNQLAYPGVGRYLFDKGVLYAPDYVVNAGGIINVAAEIRALASGSAYDPQWVEQKVARVVSTLQEVLDRAQAERRPPHEVADEVARDRIAHARA